MYKILTEEAQN